MKTALLTIVWLCFAHAGADAQAPTIRYGSGVSPEVRLMYERGLTYLADSQQGDGSWGDFTDRNGVTGLCLMAFFAGGEDPNYGRYTGNVRRALRSIIRSQDPRTGYIPDKMYSHGFATLALAEAYGAVDDTLLWEDRRPSESQRSIGAALDLAVRCCVASQNKNPFGAWRYYADSSDADTSVSGAVLVALLAARNAGIHVPQSSIDKALTFYRERTSDSGQVAYMEGHGGPGTSMNRSAIATLVLAVGKRKDCREYQATLAYLLMRLDHEERSYPAYFRYYMAQALFQGSFDAWEKWNRDNTRRLRSMQSDDGSFPAQRQSPAYSTAMSLLSLALNFRFLPIYER